MRTTLIATTCAAVITFWATGCVPPGRITARDLNRFAIKASEAELWREAEFRLKQALEKNPGDARLFNNLGVALEAQGKLEEAHAAYLEAVKLDPSNETYRRNLREFNDAHRWEYGAGDATPAGDNPEDQP